MVYSYLTVQMPANVTMVMRNINSIASLDYLPIETLFSYMFTFSDTEELPSSFQSMGVDSPRLSQYMGSLFFVFALLFV